MWKGYSQLLQAVNDIVSVEYPPPPHGKVAVSFKMVKLFTDYFKLNAVAHAHESYVKTYFVAKDSNKAFLEKFITSRPKG